MLTPSNSILPAGPPVRTSSVTSQPTPGSIIGKNVDWQNRTCTWWPDFLSMWPLAWCLRLPMITLSQTTKPVPSLDEVQRVTSALASLDPQGRAIVQSCRAITPCSSLYETLRSFTSTTPCCPLEIDARK